MTGNTDNVSPSASPSRGYQWSPYEVSEAEKQLNAYLRQELEWAAPDNPQPLPDADESLLYASEAPSPEENMSAERMREYAAYQARKGE